MIATGGLGKIIADETECIDLYDPQLTLNGLRMIHEKVQKKRMKKLKIGNVELENRYLLGPMAGVTDLPFRLLCKEQGAGLLGMEMVSAKAILYQNKNTEKLMEIHPEEQPVSLQLFGSDPKIMSEMAKRIEERPFAILDINMGCPVPKVVKKRGGVCFDEKPLSCL
mgnify:CR=1 FL=1